jgi:hypothetical protein
MPKAAVRFREEWDLEPAVASVSKAVDMTCSPRRTMIAILRFDVFVGDVVNRR